MLPVPAKSSETRAILLLISSDTEHLWIRITNLLVDAGKTQKIIGIGLLLSKSPVLQPRSKTGVEIG
jgi:hypothetical protein